MKIISKFKDYFHHLQGLYGVDYTVIYNTSAKDEIMAKVSDYNLSLRLNTIFLCICDVIYVVYIYKNVVYVGDEIKTILEKIPVKPSKWNRHKNEFYYYLNGEHVDIWDNYHLMPTDLNTKEKCVALICERFHRSNQEIKSRYFRMSDFGINRVVSAHDMYISVNNFLVKLKDIENITTDTRTDKDKILTNGFDVKTSFRNV